MFLTMQQQDDLVVRKLATKKVNGNYVTYKYAKKVMYDYLWQQHPELLECRGHTYDIRTGELVLAAPRKSFNYLELDTWAGVSLDTPVIAFRKWNGFMASARIVDGELLVATTGTTNPETSKYVEWARREIEKLGSIFQDMTTIYEIVIPEDPHIVDDGKIGAIPLFRRDEDGMYRFHFGNEWFTTLGEVLKASHTEKHEGWMVYDQDEYETGVPIPSTCKIKTDYYVGKKKLMRMSKEKAGNLFADNVTTRLNVINTLGNQWRVLAAILPSKTTKEVWVNSTDQERRAIIEALEDKYCGD